jgi:nucleoside-diphosphate-sugar epimerase
MFMKVLVTGGSGYIGRATIEALIAGGHGVEALARNENSAARVREAGAAPVVGALSDLEVLRSAASRSDAVIHLAQADSGEADLAAATAMLDGVGAGVYVHTGGTWVYGNTNGVVDETAPWDPPLLVAWRRSVEEAVLGQADSGGHPVIVQPGLLYGGDNRLIEMFYAAPGRDAGYMSHIGDGSNHWALVHVEDVARLYVAALQAHPGSVYAGVGGVNPTAKEVAVALSRAAGLGDGVKSMTIEDATEQMGPVADAFALDQQLSSARAQSELDWTPRHLDPLAVLSHH